MEAHSRRNIHKGYGMHEGDVPQPQPRYTREPGIQLALYDVAWYRQTSGTAPTGWQWPVTSFQALLQGSAVHRNDHHALEGGKARHARCLHASSVPDTPTQNAARRSNMPKSHTTVNTVRSSLSMGRISTSTRAERMKARHHGRQKDVDVSRTHPRCLTHAASVARLPRQVPARA